MFSRMQQVLPPYEEVVEKLLSRAHQKDERMPNRIMNALAFVYSDLVRFCFDASRIFTKRRSVTLFWQPFDAKFEAILKRFGEHKDLMDLEMMASSHKSIIKVEDTLSSMSKTVESQWSVQDDIVRSQKRSAIGKPGYGKTALCSALIHHVFSLYGSSSTAPDIVFFCFDKQSEHARQAPCALRAILAQLLQKQGGSEQGINIASLLWYQRRSGQQTASNLEIKELLNITLGQTDQVVLLLDGIDECADTRGLSSSLESVGLISSKHAIAFFGRPTVTLPKRLSEFMLAITLKNEQNLEDIRRYLRQPISDMIDDGTLPEEIQVESTVEKISNRANGMFLWASLFIEYLSLAAPALTMSQRRYVIENLSRLEGLDTLFGEIMKALSHKYSGEARLNIQHLFQWVVCSLRPLLVVELNCAMTVPLDRKLKSDDGFGNLSHSLSGLSGALLEVAPDETVRFIHLSAREYFQHWKPQDSSTSDSTSSFASFYDFDASIYCSAVCCSYVLHTVGVGPLSGTGHTSLDEQALAHQYPLLNYASEYLFEHMLKAVSTIGGQSANSDVCMLLPLLGLARSFLTSKKIISTWIEACWTFGRKPRISEIEDRLGDLNISERHSKLDRATIELLRQGIESLSRLAEDLTQLNHEWGKVLAETPNEIWEPSITAFLRSDFWVSVDGTKLYPLSSSNQSQFVCLNSRNSIDGKEAAIIKVQPPAYDPLSSVSTTQTVWKVRHEIWILKSMTIRACTSFQVPSSMVPFSYIWEEKDDLQDDEPILEFLCPTTISSDLRHLTFLNIAGTLVDEYVFSSNASKVLGQRPKMQLQTIDVSLETDREICGTFNFDWSAFHNGFWTHMSDSGKYFLVLSLLPANQSQQVNNSTDVPSAKIWFVRVYQNEDYAGQEGPSFKLMSSIAFIPDRITALKDRPFTFHPELPLLVIASGRTAWIERTDREMGVHILNIANPVAERDERPSYQRSPFQKPPTGALTLIWNFSHKGSKPISIGSLMRDVHFSNDAKKLYGTVGIRKVMVEVPFDKLGMHGNAEGFGGHTALISANQQLSIASPSALRALSRGPTALTQDSNSLVFSRDSQGRAVASDLRQSHEHGALVLRTLCDNRMTQETLTRLPRWVDEESEATLLSRPEADGKDPDGVVRVMLNRAAGPFKKYKTNEQPFVPTLLERQNRTISSFATHGNHLLRDGAWSPTRVLEFERHDA
ncbi:MAG: hypothetical protein Q9157_003359 [Trypethelium eluteriae]